MAVVAEVAVDTKAGRVTPLRMSDAVDAGRAVDPDGVRNQIEGGMAQATSWTLQESGHWDNGIMTAVDYGAYPIQDFITTPAMASIVIDQPKLPSLGAGEGSKDRRVRPSPDAVFAATGRRVGEIPLSPERVLAALRA